VAVPPDCLAAASPGARLTGESPATRLPLPGQRGECRSGEGRCVPGTSRACRPATFPTIGGSPQSLPRNPPAGALVLLTTAGRVLPVSNRGGERSGGAADGERRGIFAVALVFVGRDGGGSAARGQERGQAASWTGATSVSRSRGDGGPGRGGGDRDNRRCRHLRLPAEMTVEGAPGRATQKTKTDQTSPEVPDLALTRGPDVTVAPPRSSVARSRGAGPSSGSAGGRS